MTRAIKITDNKVQEPKVKKVSIIPISKQLENFEKGLINLDAKRNKKFFKDKKALKHISLVTENNEKHSKVDEQKQKRKQTKESDIRHLTL